MESLIMVIVHLIVIYALNILNVLNNLKCQYLSFLGVYSIMLYSSTGII